MHGTTRLSVVDDADVHAIWYHVVGEDAFGSGDIDRDVGYDLFVIEIVVECGHLRQTQAAGGSGTDDDAKSSLTFDGCGRDRWIRCDCHRLTCLLRIALECPGHVDMTVSVDVGDSALPPPASSLTACCRNGPIKALPSPIGFRFIIRAVMNEA